MGRVTVKDIEELAAIQSQLCISIYIPTHRYGHQVNDGEDRIVFKNELQRVKNLLLDRGYQERYVKELLQPAQDLYERQLPWRHMEDGLAVFISDNFFKYTSYPVKFETQTYISKDMILIPLVGMMSNNGEFMILKISQKGINLYRADRFDIEEIPLQGLDIPEDVEKVWKYFEFQPYLHRRATTGPKGLAGNFHGHGQDDDKTDKYVGEFLNRVDTGLMEILSNEDIPLVLAGVENSQVIYKNVSNYRNIFPEGINGNPDQTDPKELHKKGWELLSKKYTKTVRKEFENYNMLAGTGKTSYDLGDIFVSALAGRVQSVFFEKDTHAWAEVNPRGEVIVHDEQQENDIDLINSCIVQTILNNGNAFEVEKGQMPEKSVNTRIAAVYRY